MGSLQAESEEKLEMDDSGCIQDEIPPSKRYDNGHQGVHLLDLSDDVLLLILRFLTPRDLKALGYTCPRLGALVLDRSLWQVVDARGQPWSRARLRWYLARALHAGTRELLVAGYAREAGQCLGHVNQTREEIEAARLLAGDKDSGKEEDNNNTEADDEMEQSDSQSGQSDRSQSPRIIDVPALGPNAQLFIEDGRDESSEAWAWPRASEPLVSDSTCPGPQFTLTQCVLRQLADTCPALTSLALEYCNINCNTTSITQFPSTLKKLSLRGSKCYNLPMDRSFLFKIQDTMPGLEAFLDTVPDLSLDKGMRRVGLSFRDCASHIIEIELHLQSLDVSECEWMEPASLLPLSKLLALKHLYARDCLRLTEFVAYASLATRYGFTELESLDLRGSPVGDSEVSALGWLARLTQLWLSPARPPPAHQHSHHKQDKLPRPGTPARDRWEAEEPDYFKIKDPDYDPKTERCDADENKHTWQASLSKGLNGNATSFNSAQSSIPNTISSPSPHLTIPTTSNAAQSNTSPKANQSSSQTAPNHPKSPNSSPGKSKPSNQSPSQSKSLNHLSPGQTTSPSQSKTPNPSPGQSKSCKQQSPGQLKSLNPSPGQSKSSKQPSPGQSKSPAKSKAPKRKPPSSPSPGPSKRKRDDSDSSSDDDDLPLKCLIKKGNVNEGASTSREEPQAQREEEPAQNAEAQPRHHVLYVNVGQQVHAVYRLSLDNEHIVSFNRNPNVRRINNRNVFLSPPGAHLDASSLVTDSAIRRFGRADGEDINYVHIGPNGPYPVPSTQGARPDRSSLTHLSVTGFRYITDSSLNHLATSAPYLRFLDLSETNVTDAGVANFRSLRPDCEVRYSKYVKKD